MRLFSMHWERTGQSWSSSRGYEEKRFRIHQNILYLESWEWVRLLKKSDKNVCDRSIYEDGILYWHFQSWFGSSKGSIKTQVPQKPVSVGPPDAGFSKCCLTLHSSSFCLPSLLSFLAWQYNCRECSSVLTVPATALLLSCCYMQPILQEERQSYNGIPVSSLPLRQQKLSQTDQSLLVQQ